MGSWPRTQAETNANMFDHNGAVLFEELKTLELELHKDETRRNANRMEALLHPDFVEFGRSGRRYSRADILNQFGPNGGSATRDCVCDGAAQIHGSGVAT